jgi:hypothetical protein
LASPYGLDIVDSCMVCKLRSPKFFCDLPKASMEAFDAIKYSASYPGGAMLFTEGQCSACTRPSPERRTR